MFVLDTNVISELMRPEPGYGHQSSKPLGIDPVGELKKHTTSPQNQPMLGASAD